MTHDKLSEICTDLSQCLSFPSMLTIRHKNLVVHIDSLLTRLSKYKDRLSKDHIHYKTIHHKRMEPYVSVESDSTTVFIPPPCFFCNGAGQFIRG